MMHLATTRYGTMECLNSDSVVSRSLLHYGEWAQAELDIISGLVRQGFVALDVGAFLGTHTLALASMVGSAGRVHSFEPREAIRAILERNVHRNGLQTVTVHPCALGARTGSLELPTIDINSETNFGGLALVGAVEIGQPAESIRIERLDDLVCGPIDFIKIDAEGMEADVLAGALALLTTSQPVLMAECNDLEHGSRVLRTCLDLSYEVYGVLSPAYNPANLRGNAVNIFGDASEASLVALPANRAASLAPPLQAQLVPIRHLDDLALLLLHKAQYPAEVLAVSSAALALGVDYESPLARRLRDEIAELRAALPCAFERAQIAEQHAAIAANEIAAALEQAWIERTQAAERFEMLAEKAAKAEEVLVERAQTAEKRAVEAEKSVSATAVAAQVVVDRAQAAEQRATIAASAAVAAAQAMATTFQSQLASRVQAIDTDELRPSGSPDCGAIKHSLDSVIVRDGRMFAYGWAYDPLRPVQELVLQITYEDGAHARMPVTVGKERPDVLAAFPNEPLARWSGWMAYVGWDRPAKCVDLVVTLEGDESFMLPVLGEPKAVPLVQRLQQLVRTALGQSRSAPCDAVADDTVLVSTIHSALKAAGLTGLSLVLDHSMGGGANKFRHEWVKARLTKLPMLAVLHFEVHRMTWVLELHLSSGHVLRFPCTADLPRELAQNNLVKEVFVNDVVSFPDPLQVPQWLQGWADAGAQITIAVHDYMSICPSPFLLNDANRYCGVPSLKECRQCLQTNSNTFPVVRPGPDIVAWRKAWGESLELASQVVSFSDSSRRILLHAYPTLADSKINVVPHEVAPFAQAARVENLPVDGPLHVGVVGAIGLHKGAAVLQSLVEEASMRGADMRITVFGTLESATDESVVTVTGPYQREDLPGLIENSGANVFLLPSICPETFSYVTHELIGMGLPLACFDLGAPADRVRSYSRGRVLAMGDAQQLLDDMILFHHDLQTTTPREGL